MTPPKLNGKNPMSIKITALIAGIQAEGALPKGYSLWIDDVNYASDPLVTRLLELRAPYDRTEDARAELKAAEKAEKEAEMSTSAFVSQAIAGIKVAVGPDSGKLAKFSVKTKAVPPPRTAEQRLQMALKAAATRKLRGTLTPTQKKALKATTVPTTKLVVDSTGVHTVVDTAPPETPIAK
jgi:hypothetical protein